RRPLHGAAASQGTCRLDRGERNRRPSTCTGRLVRRPPQCILVPPQRRGSPPRRLVLRRSSRKLGRADGSLLEDADGNRLNVLRDRGQLSPISDIDVGKRIIFRELE